MKIALYVPVWPPGTVANGIVTYAAQIVPELRKLGHEVFILTWNTAANEEDIYTVDLKKYEKPTSLRRRFLFKIAPGTAAYRNATETLVAAVKDLVAKHGIDVLEMEETFGWSKAISDLGLLPVIVRLHGPWFMNGRFNSTGLYSCADKRRERREEIGIKDASFVTAPSSYVLQSVKSHYKLELQRSLVIPNPINTVSQADRWSIETCDRDALLYVGRFDAIKGGDLVIHAFGELAATHPNLKLTFVGPDKGIRGPDGKIFHFHEYARMVLSEDAISRLSFKGQLTQSEIVALRTRHIVTLCAARVEIFGYVVLESVSTGCPTIASSVGGIPEIIESGKNGFLFPSEDLSSLISACKKMLDDHSLATQLADQAWKDCRDNYDIKFTVLQTIQIYQTMNDDC